MSNLNLLRAEDAPAYQALPQDSDHIIEQAINLLRQKLKEPGVALTSPEATKRYLALRIATQEREVFGCLWLDNQHRVLEDEPLFLGTIDGASVYPREVVKACLARNAAAVIFYHNHPSGICEPSSADQAITQKLKSSLQAVDVRVLDHVIIGGIHGYSFAEHGLL
jgi:DNA repair protein RadC